MNRGCRYKYVVGTDSWKNKKGQNPAWCDRVLYRSTASNGATNSDKPGDIHVKEYKSCQELRISDHKPVRAVLSARIKWENKDKKKEVYRKIIRSLDDLENSARPSVQIDSSVFLFENVEYLLPQTKICDVVNFGELPAKVTTIPKPGEKVITS